MVAVKITKDKFEEFVKVQKSGVTNMFDIKTVKMLSGLTKAECLDIMKNYKIYKRRFK